MNLLFYQFSHYKQPVKSTDRDRIIDCEELLHKDIVCSSFTNANVQMWETIKSAWKRLPDLHKCITCFVFSLFHHIKIFIYKSTFTFISKDFYRRDIYQLLAINIQREIESDIYFYWMILPFSAASAQIRHGRAYARARHALNSSSSSCTSLARELFFFILQYII